MTHDWLLDDPRSHHARERLIDRATTLIRERGIDAFDVNELARRAHCSRATVYRHAGGKQQLIDAVLARSSTQIVEAVMSRTAHLTGADRSVAAIHVALGELRADRVLRGVVHSRHFQSVVPAAAGASAVTGAAAALLGLGPQDSAGAQWAIRGVVAMVLWPMSAEHERAAVDALVAGLDTRHFSDRAARACFEK